MNSVRLATRLAVCCVALVALTACEPTPDNGAQAIAHFAMYGDVMKVHVDTCDGNQSAQVSETDADVTITVTATAGSPSGACVKDFSVTLAAPLGGRTVIDGATGKTPAQWAP